MGKARSEASARLPPSQEPRGPFRVLFLCTGNSARSIMAECAMNRWGTGQFVAFSAGSHPRGQIHPMTLELLTQLGYPTERLRSKSWDEFARPGRPLLDVVITVCDSAAGEACPLWPGRPVTAHWGVRDPAIFVGPPDAQRRFFAQIYLELENRIKILAGPSPHGLDLPELKRRLDELGDGPASAPS
jgi:protein-tyrosine-phosphatase